jgi:hypothetical protein
LHSFRRDLLPVLYFTFREVTPIEMEWGRRKVQEGNSEQRTSHTLR